jgi:DNA polymerase
MGALNMGLTEEELPGIVEKWRQASPHIVRYWWDVDRAVKQCVITHMPQQVRNIKFSYEKGILFIRLPSGRRLAYVKPRLGVNRFGGESVTYEGVGEQKKWIRLESFGGKFTENIVQAASRDLLVAAMRRLSHKGYKIVMHVHDEVVLEVPDGVSSVEEVCSIMAETPAWAEGLILNADGYECNFYKKD